MARYVAHPLLRHLLRSGLRLAASPDAQDGSLLIHQNAQICLSTLEADLEVRHELQTGRHAWLQVLRGSVELNGHSLATSDGAAVSDETTLAIQAKEPSEVMLFDLP
jgi:redox-sensitive bicupin YhaK (pirin superfamily)